MKELSLHILDLAQNGIAAGATQVDIEVNEDEKGYFVFRIRDNGRGMSPELLQRVRDPFVTTRTTRKVGLGIPFIDMMTQQCGGYLNLTSKEGQGTLLEAAFAKDNIDRPPLGDLPSTMKVLLVGAPTLDFTLTYKQGEDGFTFSTRQLRQELGAAADFTQPALYGWVEGYLRQEIAELHKKQED